MWPQTARRGRLASIVSRIATLPRCSPAAEGRRGRAAASARPGRRRSGQSASNLVASSLGEVEAPVPRCHRDAGAEPEEGDARRARSPRRGGPSPPAIRARASRSASCVSLLPGTSSVGVSIAASAAIVCSRPWWTEAKSPAPMTRSASALSSTSFAAWSRSQCRSLNASSLHPCALIGAVGSGRSRVRKLTRAHCLVGGDGNHQCGDDDQRRQRVDLGRQRDQRQRQRARDARWRLSEPKLRSRITTWPKR